MEKEGQLWDDSALINAFDNAMSQYKTMHRKKNYELLHGGGKEELGEQEGVSKFSEEDDAAVRKEDIKNTGMVNTDKEVREPDEHISENPSINTSAATSLPGPSDSYSYSQETDDYNKLLNQYYELEAQKNNVLLQLQQSVNRNQQGSAHASGFDPGLQQTSLFYQQYPGLVNQTSHHTDFCSCFPYSCPIAAACPASACCFGETCIPQVSPIEDGGICRRAIEAAERAMSSLEMKSSASLVHEEEKGKKEDAEMAKTTSSQTELSDVLMAWYSAGFCTGKYLAEQSAKKKLHSGDCSQHQAEAK